MCYISWDNLRERMNCIIEKEVTRMATSFLKNTNKGLFLEVTVVQTFKAFTVTSFIFCHFMNSIMDCI